MLLSGCVDTATASSTSMTGDTAVEEELDDERFHPPSSCPQSSQNPMSFSPPSAPSSLHTLAPPQVTGEEGEDDFSSSRPSPALSPAPEASDPTSSRAYEERHASLSSSSSSSSSPLSSTSQTFSSAEHRSVIPSSPVSSGPRRGPDGRFSRAPSSSSSSRRRHATDQRALARSGDVSEDRAERGGGGGGDNSWEDERSSSHSRSEKSSSNRVVRSDQGSFSHDRNRGSFSSSFSSSSASTEEGPVGKLQLLLEYGESYLLSLCNNDTVCHSKSWSSTKFSSGGSASLPSPSGGGSTKSSSISISRSIAPSSSGSSSSGSSSGGRSYSTRLSTRDRARRAKRVISSSSSEEEGEREAEGDGEDDEEREERRVASSSSSSSHYDDDSSHGTSTFTKRKRRYSDTKSAEDLERPEGEERDLLRNGSKNVSSSLREKRRRSGRAGAETERSRCKGRGGDEDYSMEEDFDNFGTNDGGGRAGCVVTRLTTHPSILKCAPKPYQLEGLNWLIQLYERNMNGILADEMGLGKTYQTISLLAFLKEGKGIDGPHLILAPKSTIGNWMTEFRKFCPSINAVKVLGDKETRRATLAHIVERTSNARSASSINGNGSGSRAGGGGSEGEDFLSSANSSSSADMNEDMLEDEEEISGEKEGTASSSSREGDSSSGGMTTAEGGGVEGIDRGEEGREGGRDRGEGTSSIGEEGGGGGGQSSMAGASSSSSSLGEEEPLPDRVDAVVTSFEMCILERAQFMKVNWEYIVIDEAHRIKNESSKLAQTARLFNTRRRLLLTGTPLQNNLRELWALLNFLFPSLFSSSTEFEQLFDLTGGGGEGGGDGLSAEKREERNMKIVTRLHSILRPFMLRRVKKEVLKEMPPKKELLLFVPLSAMQKRLYKDLLTKNVSALQGAEGAGRTQLLNLAMQLRKACNHPYLFEGFEPENADPFGEHVIENAGKLRFCDRLLRRLIMENRRCLIFTQMTRMIDILEDYCRIRQFKYCRIDGNTSGDDRDRQIESFNAPGSDIPVFLLSTRAGGLGINLATADTVILYDSDWNPQVDLQAMDRVHRIGQKSAVNVYRLIHEHTIEEKIIEKATLKLQLDTAIIQQGRLSDQQNQQKQLSKNELMTMVQFGADHIFKSGAGDDLTEEDLEAILARGQARTDTMNEKLQTHVKKSLLDFSISPNPSSNLYEYDGVDYTDQQRKADREAWAALAVQTLEAQNERESRRRMRLLKEQEVQLQMQQSADQRKVKHIPRAVRLPPMQEWQFYDRARIEQLHTAELNFYRNQGNAKPPTDEEREEKQRLLREGFGSWGKRDFIQFVRGNEMYGRHDLARIATEVDGKTLEEVAAYSQVFWRRYKEIAGWEKWIRRIEEGEAVINKRRELEQVIARRQQQYDVPWRRLLIPYGGALKSRSIFTEGEDRWILNMTTLLGYGNWDKLRDLMLRDSQWRFDWFMRSRSGADLGKRAEALVRLLKKEEGERFTRGRRRLDLPDTPRPSAVSVTSSAGASSVAPNAATVPVTGTQLAGGILSEACGAAGEENSGGVSGGSFRGPSAVGGGVVEEKSSCRSSRRPRASWATAGASC